MAKYRVQLADRPTLAMNLLAEGDQPWPDLRDAGITSGDMNLLRTMRLITYKPGGWGHSGVWALTDEGRASLRPRET